jgi:hypothetical protein
MAEPLFIYHLAYPQDQNTFHIGQRINCKSVREMACPLVLFHQFLRPGFIQNKMPCHL